MRKRRDRQSSRSTDNLLDDHWTRGGLTKDRGAASFVNRERRDRCASTFRARAPRDAAQGGQALRPGPGRRSRPASSLPSRTREGCFRAGFSRSAEADRAPEAIRARASPRVSRATFESDADAHARAPPRNSHQPRSSRSRRRRARDLPHLWERPDVGMAPQRSSPPAPRRCRWPSGPDRCSPSSSCTGACRRARRSPASPSGWRSASRSPSVGATGRDPRWPLPSTCLPQRPSACGGGSHVGDADVIHMSMASICRVDVARRVETVVVHPLQITDPNHHLRQPLRVRVDLDPRQLRRPDLRQEADAVGRAVGNHLFF